MSIFIGNQIYINSWYNFCIDYEIIHWHDKLPEFQEMLKKSTYMRDCFKHKIWEMVSDVVRAYAVAKYGGLSLDTDVQVVKPIDNF